MAISSKKESNGADAAKKKDYGTKEDERRSQQPESKSVQHNVAVIGCLWIIKVGIVCGIDPIAASDKPAEQETVNQ